MRCLDEHRADDLHRRSSLSTCCSSADDARRARSCRGGSTHVSRRCSPTHWRGGDGDGPMIDEVLYYRLFEEAEKVRWQLGDIPWQDIDYAAVNEELVLAVRSAIAGELGTFGGTRQFMDLFASDGDFTQWLAVWFYEE